MSSADLDLRFRFFLNTGKRNDFNKISKISKNNYFFFTGHLYASMNMD